MITLLRDRISSKQVQVSKWHRMVSLTDTNIWRINLVCGHSFYLVLEKHGVPRYSMECWKCNRGEKIRANV